MRIRRKISVFLLLIFVAGCTSAPVKDGAQKEEADTSENLTFSDEPMATDGPEGKAFLEIQNLYQLQSLDTASKKIAEFEKKYPSSVALGRIHNLQGLIYLLKKNHSKAEARFNKALSLSQSGEFRHFIFYNLASLSFEMKKMDQAKKHLNEIDPGLLNAGTRLKYHYLKSLVSLRQGDARGAAKEILNSSYIVDAMSGASNEQTKFTFTKQLKASIDLIREPADLEDLFREYQHSSLAEPLVYRLATQALSSRNLPAAENYFRVLVTKFPSSEHYIEAINYLRMSQMGKPVDQRAVGVLLPLTGKFSKFGNSSLQGIELAFRVFNSKEGNSKVTLYIEDSGDTVEQAMSGLEKLAYEKNVIAIIGPLLSKGIEQISKKADDIGVPLISLAQQKGPDSEYVFQSAISLKDQAVEIARFAVQRKGLKRIAILYPLDRFGNEYMTYFWDAVESFGGEITAVESYTSKETDFRVPIEKLVGLYYKDARSRELEELKKLRELNNIKKMTHRTTSYFKLPPIIEFDAVFIPDEAKTIGQVLPSFTYLDVDEAIFLGISSWSAIELLNRAKNESERAFFISSFFSGSSSPVTKEFMTGYKATFNEQPTMIEAAAYDMASILEQSLVTASSSASRSEVREILKNVSNFQGVTGKITCQNNTMVRQLKVLNAQKGQIVEAN